MSLDREKFHKPVKILRKLLKKFPRRPLPEHVHRLRTHTRRLDAVLRGLMLTSRRNERRLVEAIDFGTLIWPHFGRLMWPHLIYSDRSSYPVPASRDGEGDGQETQGGTV